MIKYNEIYTVFPTGYIPSFLGVEVFLSSLEFWSCFQKHAISDAFFTESGPSLPGRKNIHPFTGPKKSIRSIVSQIGALGQRLSNRTPLGTNEFWGPWSTSPPSRSRFPPRSYGGKPGAGTGRSWHRSSSEGSQPTSTYHLSSSQPCPSVQIPGSTLSITSAGIDQQIHPSAPGPNGRPKRGVL